MENAGGHSYFAKEGREVCKIVDYIIGEGKKLIVKAKLMVTEEIRLREHLIERGHEVYETDLGELPHTRRRYSLTYGEPSAWALVYWTLSLGIPPTSYGR